MSETELASFSGSGYVPQALLLLDDDDDEADEEDLSVGRESRFVQSFRLKLSSTFYFPFFLFEVH